MFINEEWLKGKRGPRSCGDKKQGVTSLVKVKERWGKDSSL
jgi:hypothetical protein